MAKRHDDGTPCKFRRRATRKQDRREKPDRDGLAWLRETRQRRGCSEKVRFVSRRHVGQGIARIVDMGGPKLRYYRCRYCKGYHLTSKGTAKDV